MTVYPYSHRHVWTQREGVTFVKRLNPKIVLHKCKSQDSWIRHLSNPQCPQGQSMLSVHVIHLINSPELRIERRMLAYYSSALTIGIWDRQRKSLDWYIWPNHFRTVLEHTIQKLWRSNSFVISFTLQLYELLEREVLYKYYLLLLLRYWQQTCFIKFMEYSLVYNISLCENYANSNA